MSILTSSFFGSWHCAAMCGPIAANITYHKSLLPYHLGRMITYTCLGVIAGASGESFLNSHLRWLSHISIILMSATLAYYGWMNLSNKESSQFLLKNVFNKIQSISKNRHPLFVGLMTGFLPCGWLYTYVLACVASKSAYAGLLIMFLFWLGGLPALSAVPILIKKSARKASLHHRRIAGIILVVASLYAMMSHFLFGYGII